MLGTKYYQHKTRASVLSLDGSVKQYRYYKKNGNKFYDVGFNHLVYGNPSIKFPHYHGWTGSGIRATNHQSYLQMILWLIGGLFR